MDILIFADGHHLRWRANGTIDVSLAHNLIPEQHAAFTTARDFFEQAERRRLPPTRPEVVAAAQSLGRAGLDAAAYYSREQVWPPAIDWRNLRQSAGLSRPQVAAHLTEVAGLTNRLPYQNVEKWENGSRPVPKRYVPLLLNLYAGGSDEGKS